MGTHECGDCSFHKQKNLRLAFTAIFVLFTKRAVQALFDTALWEDNARTTIWKIVFFKSITPITSPFITKT
ncbi:hypothetical protein QVL58_07205, partial [Bartonella henselae]|nr:hypothetical protein [Bartonella henselae]